MSTPTFWLSIGLLGQALFSARFLVQWLASERVRQSIVPTAFWWLSLAGGVTLLAYAISRRDPVFIIGQGSGLIVYIRNLMLIRRSRDEVHVGAHDEAHIGAKDENRAEPASTSQARGTTA